MYAGCSILLITECRCSIIFIYHNLLQIAPTEGELRQEIKLEEVGNKTFPYG